jgi:hypothetical protein
MKTRAMPPPRALDRTIPLRWVVVAILVFIAGYTFLRLHFAKHEKLYEPYHDIRERIAAKRLVELGYQRVAVEIERPAEILPASQFAPTADEVASSTGGLPPELAGALFPKPALPALITGVTAPREIATGGVYALQFTCEQSDYKTQIDSVVLLRKGPQLYLLPDFPRLAGRLLARYKDTDVFVRIPLHGFPNGRYSATLCGARNSKTWQFTVR